MMYSIVVIYEMIATGSNWTQYILVTNGTTTKYYHEKEIVANIFLGLGIANFVLVTFILLSFVTYFYSIKGLYIKE
jgi:hypothetical protein